MTIKSREELRQEINDRITQYSGDQDIYMELAEEFYAEIARLQRENEELAKFKFGEHFRALVEREVFSACKFWSNGASYNDSVKAAVDAICGDSKDAPDRPTIEEVEEESLKRLTEFCGYLICDDSIKIQLREDIKRLLALVRRAMGGTK